MKLETIKISNYRCFEELSVNFQDDVTLFVGINGSGKSSILDAIAIALYDVVAANSGADTEEWRRRNRAAVEEADFYLAALPPLKPIPYVIPRSTSVHILAEARPSDHTKKILNGNSNRSLDHLRWLNTITDTLPASTIYQLTSDSNIKQWFASIWNQISQNPQDNISVPLVAYYRADRKFVAPAPVTGVPTGTHPRQAAFEDSLAAGVNYSTAADWFFQNEFYELQFGADNSFNSSSNSTDYRDPVLTRVREAIQKAFPNIERIGFSGRPPTLKVLMKSGNDRRWLNISQLSDGYRALLGLIVDFARRLATANPNSNDPLSEAAILLIDEIELHLHPGWQQTVIPRLRQAFPGTQIIATTHSPQVLTSVEGACIRILRDGQLFAAPQSTSGAESKRVLEDVFGVSSRPPKDVSPFVAELDDLYNLIDADKLDEARAMVEQLKERAYDDDPAVIEAEVMVENRLWEKETVG